MDNVLFDVQKIVGERVELPENIPINASPKKQAKPCVQISSKLMNNSGKQQINTMQAQRNYISSQDEGANDVSSAQDSVIPSQRNQNIPIANPVVIQRKSTYLAERRAANNLNEIMSPDPSVQSNWSDDEGEAQKSSMNFVRTKGGQYLQV